MSAGGAKKLPTGWARCQLEDLVVPSTERVDPNREPGAPYVGLEHVEPHTGRLIGTGSASDVRSATGRFRAGDVLYGRLRPYLNKVFFARKDGLCSSEFAVFRPVGVSPEFLALRLRNDDVIRYAMSFNVGVHRPRIRWPQLREFAVALPPRGEQDRIVEAVESAIAAVNDAETSLSEAEMRLGKLRLSVLAAAITGGLPVSDHASTDARELLQCILDEHERTSNGKTKKLATPTPLEGVKLPTGWTWATVDQLATLVQYGSSAKTTEDASGIPVLRMGNLVDGELDLSNLKYLPKTHDEFPDLHLEEGDVLFNRTNSPELVGKSAIYRGVPKPSSFASYLIRVRLSKRYRPELLNYFLGSALGRAWVSSVVSQQVGQANVNGTKLKQLTVPVPPPETQDAVCELAENSLSQISAMRHQLDNARVSVQALRRAVLHRAFTGQLVPQDPNDEPASELLERIKAEQTEREAELKAAAKRRKASSKKSKESPKQARQPAGRVATS